MIIWNSGVIIFLFINNYISKGSDFLNVIIKHGNIKENIRIKASFPFILHYMLFFREQSSSLDKSIFMFIIETSIFFTCSK